MEIKGDLGRGGDLHDPIRVELLDNGEFQTLPLSDREVSYVTLTAVFLSPHFRPPCCRDVLRDSGRKLITKSLNLQFYSKVPLDKVVASASVAVWVVFFGLIMKKVMGGWGTNHLICSCLIMDSWDHPKNPSGFEFFLPLNSGGETTCRIHPFHSTWFYIPQSWKKAKDTNLTGQKQDEADSPQNKKSN